MLLLLALMFAAAITQSTAILVMLSPPSIITLLTAAPPLATGWRTERRARRQRIQAVHQENLLPRQARGSAAVEHFEVVDAVQRGIIENRGPAHFVAATVDHELPPLPP